MCSQHRWRSAALCLLVLTAVPPMVQAQGGSKESATLERDTGALTSFSSQTSQVRGATRATATPVQFGFGLLVGVPVGDFGSSVGTGAGISGHVGANLGDSVVSLAGETAYWWYGHEENTVALGTIVPDVRSSTSVRVSTDNAVFQLHGRVRAQSRHGRWRPYAEGLFGFTDLVTKTSIDAIDPNDCSLLVAILLGEIFGFGPTCSPSYQNFGHATNARDFAPSYGGGVGVKIGSAPRWFDVSVRYLKGGEADYLRKGAIRREGGQAILDISHSRTDTVMVYIGFAYGR